MPVMQLFRGGLHSQQPTGQQLGSQAMPPTTAAGRPCAVTCRKGGKASLLQTARLTNLLGHHRQVQLGRCRGQLVHKVI